MSEFKKLIFKVTFRAEYIPLFSLYCGIKDFQSYDWEESYDTPLMNLKQLNDFFIED